MGYNSTLTGSLVPDRPIEHGEMPASHESFDGSLKIATRELKKDVSGGVLVSIIGEAIVSASTGEWKMYKLHEELSSLVASLPPRGWSGFLERQGEEAEDAEQLRVGPGGVIESRKARRAWGDWEAVK